MPFGMRGGGEVACACSFFIEAFGKDEWAMRLMSVSVFLFLRFWPAMDVEFLQGCYGEEIG